MKNILLVGGAGFIGSHFADRLIDDNRVICIDNLSLGRLENIEHLIENSNFKFIKKDFSIQEQVEDIFSEHKIDRVIHLAANSDIRSGGQNPEIDYRDTFMTTINILNCMKKYDVKELVFSSTSAIYGEKQGQAVSEDSGPFFPISYYGGAKLACESFISSYSFMNDMKTWIFRFPNVIGERSTHGVIFDFINKLKNNNKELEILGDGTQTKPYLYVKELVDAILYALDKTDDTINYFNIGTETTTSVEEIADIIIEGMKLKSVKKVYTGGNIGWKGDVPKFNYSIEKIKKLGWSPSLTSNDAVRTSVRRILEG